MNENVSVGLVLDGEFMKLYEDEVLKDIERKRVVDYLSEEINTAAAKCNLINKINGEDATITAIVLKGSSEIEKVRVYYNGDKEYSCSISHFYSL